MQKFEQARILVGDAMELWGKDRLVVSDEIEVVTLKRGNLTIQFFKSGLSVYYFNCDFLKMQVLNY